MIITFSEKTLSSIKIANAATRKHLDTCVCLLVDRVSLDKYNGNLLASITWAKGRRVRFTIRTRDSWAKGSRTSASGRHMPHASWEAHRDVMRELLQIDPDATIRTSLATYRGLQDFEARHEATAHRNVGSLMFPCTIRECTVLTDR